MTLVLLLDRCPDQLAADMRREYGLGMHDLDPSETAALAANLPAGSLVWQTLDTPRAWTFDQYLAVLRIEQMNQWIWANGDPRKRGPQPRPLPRPGQHHATPEATGPAMEAGSENPEPDGNTIRRTRTIKAVGMSVEQLDRFMSQRFTTVNRVENRPQTGQPNRGRRNNDL